MAKKKKSFFRKLEVGGLTYRYKIGKSYTIIRGDDKYSQTVAHEKMLGVDKLPDTYSITPKDISSWIQGNRGSVAQPG